MYLAQLFAGKESLGYYQKALSLLSSAPVQDDDAKRKMAQVYTAMTELYMSDETLDLSDEIALCNNEENKVTELVTKKCESFLQEARKLDPYSAETVCCQAQFWLSVYGIEAKGSEVVALLEDFLGKIYSAASASVATVAADDANPEEKDLYEDQMESLRIEALIKCLEYDIRMEMLKLALECSCPDMASPLLDSLYSENDSPLELDYFSAMLVSQSENATSPESQDLIRENLECFVEKYSQAKSYMDLEDSQGEELAQMYENALEMLRNVTAHPNGQSSTVELMEQDPEVGK